MKMRRLIVTGSMVVLAAAPVLAKDPPSKSSFTNPVQGDTPFANCTSKGQSLAGSGPTATKAQIKLSKLQAIADSDGTSCTGDEVICITTSTTSQVGPISLVVRGEVKNGAVKIQHDLCAENPAACPVGQNSSYGVDTICYEADAAYAPALLLALSTPCEGIALGTVTPPTSAVLARAGATQDCP